MASRNERKRLAKARLAELNEAVAQAFALQEKNKLPIVVIKRNDVYDVSGAIRGHEMPRERLGSVIGGKFQAARRDKPEAKRHLVLNPANGRMIERKRSYI